MLRLSVSTTSALSARGASAPGSALPHAAACALASFRALVQGGNAFGSCGCATAGRQTHSASCRGDATHRAPAAAAAAPPAAPSASGAPVVVSPCVYQSLSLLVLLQECTRRAYGRPLLEVSDPLVLPDRLDSLPCCVVLLAPSPPPLLSQPSAAAPSARPAPGTGAVSDGSGSADGQGVGSGAQDDRDAAATLPVQYMNRAAAEALRVASSSDGGTKGTTGGSNAAAGGDAGVCAGTALLFDRWELRDGGDSDGRRVLLEGRPLVPEIPPGSAPGEEAVAGLQDAVRAQADAVRALKTQQGLPNQDPRVVAAVAQLQRLKSDLELTQRLREAFSERVGPLQALLAAEAAQ
ncbi:hypothetical protein GPECTOR_8g13 [Gonium pectorale]|uniref:Uncharacterized protein n=1 Tax=Gonium pectorale TaxID=33097 RepID=A0A150GSB5_GONPE|nr:hypothetical protein GPECTOR_8g13 [Gonium pectorale]|eukprot:KXZ52737.1 hypothetical protein GPECTOR_8g13 [Gonium pectorale]